MMLKNDRVICNFLVVQLYAKQMIQQAEGFDTRYIFLSTSKKNKVM